MSTCQILHKLRIGRSISLHWLFWPNVMDFGRHLVATRQGFEVVHLVVVTGNEVSYFFGNAKEYFLWWRCVNIRHWGVRKEKPLKLTQIWKKVKNSLSSVTVQEESKIRYSSANLLVSRPQGSTYYTWPLVSQNRLEQILPSLEVYFGW